MRACAIAFCFLKPVVLCVLMHYVHIGVYSIGACVCATEFCFLKPVVLCVLMHSALVMCLLMYANVY